MVNSRLELMNRRLWRVWIRSLQNCREVGKGTRESADIRGVILMKVIEYLSYKVQYADFNAADIKDDFTDRIDPYIALEL